MKVLFVDIDGVLRNEAFFKENMFETVADHTDGLFKFHKASVDNLNHITEKTGAKLVISSSWRLSRETNELDNLFKYNGFKGEVIGVTPVYLETYTHAIPRGKEISDWLAKNPVENYCIIDDCNDMLEEQEEHLIWIDEKVGITETDAERAVEILSK